MTLLSRIFCSRRRWRVYQTLWHRAVFQGKLAIAHEAKSTGQEDLAKDLYKEMISYPDSIQHLLQDKALRAIWDTGELHDV